MPPVNTFGTGFVSARGTASYVPPAITTTYNFGTDVVSAGGRGRGKKTPTSVGSTTAPTSVLAVPGLGITTPTFVTGVPGAGFTSTTMPPAYNYNPLRFPVAGMLGSTAPGLPPWSKPPATMPNAMLVPATLQSAARGRGKGTTTSTESRTTKPKGK
jgi:hypothetical protein